MAANLAPVRANYVGGLQNVAKLMLQLNNAMNELSNLYNGAGLSGTFTDQELAANTSTCQMLGADVGTFTANLTTVQTAMSSAILQNMAKCSGQSQY